MYVFVTTVSMFSKWKVCLFEILLLFIPQADSYWPSAWPSLMREFLNIRGCLTHILTLNQCSCSHLYHQGPAAVTYLGWGYTSSRKEHSAWPYLELLGGWVSATYKMCPPNLSPPQTDCCREFLNYKTMPFWPNHNFLSSGSLYLSPRVSYCQNQCSHGWKRPPEMQRLTVSREGPGIKGLCRVRRLVRGAEIKKTHCKVCPQHQHALCYDMGNPHPKLCL